jgi:polygalacturonase
LNTRITSPYEPVKAPSTDAIDLDVCRNVLIDGCYLSVNDDAIALKGGKGPEAHLDPLNGSNENIIIQNSQFGKCHGVLTCGSESVHNKNIILKNIHVDGPDRVLWLKNRPDTRQLYEYITVENISGKANRLLYAKPWRQFYNLEGKEKNLLSVSDHITFKNIQLKCNILADLDVTETDSLKHFIFENMLIETPKGKIEESLFDGIEMRNVVIRDK